MEKERDMAQRDWIFIVILAVFMCYCDIYSYYFYYLLFCILLCDFSIIYLQKYVYLFSNLFSRCFYPKRLSNEDILEAIKTNKRASLG